MRYSVTLFYNFMHKLLKYFLQNKWIKFYRNLLTTEAADITKGFHMLLKVQDKLWLFPLKNTRDSCSVKDIPLITDIASV